MGRARQLLTAAGLLLAFLSAAGCTSAHVHRDTDPQPTVIATHGPPPHAPAHGYRAKALDGSIIVFDASLGCYTVVGWTGVYYHDSQYYRVRDGRWERSMRLDRGWGPPGHVAVPPGLRDKVTKSRPPSSDKPKPKAKAASHDRSTPAPPSHAPATKSDVRTADKSRSDKAAPASKKDKSNGKSQGKSKSKGKNKEKDEDDGKSGKGKGKGRGKGKEQ